MSASTPIRVMAYSRSNPSPRYSALNVLYRQLHDEGEKTLGLAPEMTFPGRSLPPHAGRIKALIDTTGAKSILDYGSGKGMQYRQPLLVDGEKRFGSIREYWGVTSIRCYDPSYTPFSSLPEGQFDGVICTDVLEHCPEEDISWIVGEIFSFATRFVFLNIACYPAEKHLPNGENAHCTIRPPEWWSEMLDEAAARNPKLRWEALFDLIDDEGRGSRHIQRRLAGPGATHKEDVRALLLAGLRHHQEGQYADAAGFYEQALALDPRHPDGNRLLGTLCLQAGAFGPAEKHLRLAVELTPADAEANNNLGAVLLHQKRSHEALPFLRTAAALRPAYADALSNLGDALRQTGDTEGAHRTLNEALSVSPHHANALYNLGVLLSAVGDLGGAIAMLEAALASFPGHLAARRELANTRILACDYLAAERDCRTLLDANPLDHDVRAALVSILIASGRHDEAAVETKRILDQSPEHPQAAVCGAQILLHTGHGSDALAAFRELAARNPEEPRAALGVVEALLAEGAFEEALAQAEVAAMRFPNEGMALLDLGLTLEKSGRHEEACTAYRNGLVLLPQQPALHFNLGNQMLLLRRFEEGWQEYEWRTRLAAWGRCDSSLPLWDGGTIEGKTILLLAEQGIGDMIQFSRLAPLVAARGGRVILECQPELARLLESAEGCAQIVSKPAPADTPAEVCAPLLSLPRLLGLNENNIPAMLPTLAPPAELVVHWQARLADQPGFRVGIAWSGNRKHVDDANRSCPAELLTPLQGVAGAVFYSLQKGGETVPPGIRDFSSEWADFCDTAAFMASLDLVISVDTAAAHLAGALGLPVWTLLPFAPDWRWMLGREDSPWYPTMRLFRPRKPRAWRGLIGEVADALAERIRAA